MAGAIAPGERASPTDAAGPPLFPRPLFQIVSGLREDSTGTREGGLAWGGDSVAVSRLQARPAAVALALSLRPGPQIPGSFSYVFFRPPPEKRRMPPRLALAPPHSRSRFLPAYLDPARPPSE